MKRCPILIAAQVDPTDAVHLHNACLMEQCAFYFSGHGYEGCCIPLLTRFLAGTLQRAVSAKR